MKKLFVVLLAVSMSVPSANALEISKRYVSPRNPERKVRAYTSLIVLHTTEAPAKSSLNKVSDRGECHYVVTETGAIYAIVDRDKEAYHAGRSMWKGKEDVDKFSIGIECVGYHDKPMGQVQLKAVAELVKDLKARYKISDENVVCHSHVAYGAPNKWHKKRHRGRKQCAMLFATPTVRNILGLKARPKVDSDVKAKRLVVADKYLQSVLYGSIDPMRKHYPAFRTISAVSSAKMVKSSQDAKKVTPARQVAVSKNVSSPPKTVKALVAGGWKIKGVVDKKTTAGSVAGDKWNSSEVYYTIRDSVIPGDKINPTRIENGTMVWVKQ